jgi:hypothetical protein
MHFHKVLLIPLLLLFILNPACTIYKKAEASQQNKIRPENAIRFKSILLNDYQTIEIDKNVAFVEFKKDTVYVQFLTGSIMSIPSSDIKSILVSYKSAGGSTAANSALITVGVAAATAASVFFVYELVKALVSITSVPW